MKNLFFFFLLCTLILPSAFAQEKLNLRLQLQLNDRYRIIIPMDMPTDISMSVDEAKMKALFKEIMPADEANEATATDSSAAPKVEKTTMQMGMEMGIVMKVVEAGDKEYKLEAYYEYLESSLKSAEDSFSYSTRSSNPELSNEHKAEFESIKKVIDKKFYIVLSPNGELKSLMGYDKVISSLKKKNTANPMADDRPLLMEQLDKDEIMTTMKEIFDVFPDKPVGVGNSWTKEYEVKDELTPYKVRTKYTLKEIQADHCRILAETVLFSDRMEKQLAHVTGMGSGEILLSKKDFLAQTQPYTLDMDIDMEFLGMLMKFSTKAKGIYKIEKL